MLNENLRALRRARGLSQEELAARLPVARQTLSKWEQGRSVPDAHALARLAGELDTTVGALLGGQDPAPETQDLAARLEELNALLARRAESRRRGGALAYPEEISGKDCTGGPAGVYW